MIKLQESETLELKKSTAELKEAVISISAMLNKHQAADLYFGIKNDGTLIGQVVSDKTLREISQTIGDNIEPRIYPEIKRVNVANKPCIHVVCKGKHHPYFAFGRAYMRVADEDRQLTARELEALFVKKK